MAQEQVSRTGRNLLQVLRRELILAGIALLVVVLDQISKHYVRLYLHPGVPWNPIEPLRKYVSFTFITNTGAAFGVFPAFGTFFAVIAIIVVVGILFYSRHLSNGQWTISIGLGLQLGGALGNLLDRIHLGYVVDFVDFKIWPIFNVADASIVVGVALFALALLRDGGTDAEENVASVGQAPAD